MKLVDGETIIDLEEMKILDLHPEDVIVISAARALSMASRDRICQSLRSIFPRNKVVVLEEGMKFAAVRESGEGG